MTNEELALRIKNGEKDLILELWQQVSKLVIKIMNNRYLPIDGSTNRVEIDDLIQAGFIGMTKAIHDFDPTSGFLFTTYLGRHIANAAREVLGIRSKKRDPLLDSVSMDKSVSIGEDSNLTLADTLQDKTLTYAYDDLIEDLAKKEDIRIIFEQMKYLSPRAREIFEARFISGLSFEDTGTKYGCTRQNAYNTTNSSIWKIRRSKAIRLMAERYVDRDTNYYAGKGLKGFNTTFSSTVEDSVIKREKLRESMVLDNWSRNC